MKENGTFELLPKKEVAKLELEMEKLDKYLGGVKNMKTLPKAMFIVDPHKAVSYTHLIRAKQILQVLKIYSTVLLHVQQVDLIPLLL